VNGRQAGSVAAESGLKPNFRYRRIILVIGVFIGGTPDN
jgi:hypothetical protein